MPPNPEEFKRRIVAKYPNGVTSDGVRYADLPAQELTTRVVNKFPNGVTNDGIPYSSFLSQPQEKGMGIAGKALSFAKGVGKELVSEVTGITRTAGDITRGIRAAISPKTYGELQQEDIARVKGTPMEALVSGSEASQNLEGKLKAENPWEKAGKVGAFIGTLFIGGVTKPVTAIEKGLAAKTELSTLRLTPAAIKAFGEKKLEQISQTLVDLKLIGGPTERYAKIKTAEKVMEDTYQAALKGAKQKVSTLSLKMSLQDLAQTLIKSDPAEANAITREVQEAVTTLNRYPDWISLPELNILKRSFTDRGYSGPWKQLSNATQFAIGKVFKEAIETSAAKEGILVNGKTVADFNQAYGRLLDVKTLLKAAQGRPEIGMLTKIVSYTTGAGIGYQVGNLAGAAVGPLVASKVASTLFGTASKSLASQALMTAARGGEAVRGALSKLIPR